MRIRPFGPIKPNELVEIAEWIAAHRSEADRPFDIVLEGVTPGNDPAKATAQVKPLAEAGATWWIESRWEAPHNSPEALLERIKQGPPSI